MKCSMVKDKDHASSSPIPLHCGELSKSWTKAGKNCENKSKRLKSTKASRDQHSCTNRGAAEHCISVPRVFATVSSSDSLCSSTNRANNLSDHTHLGNQVSSNFTESVQKTITPLVSESLGNSTGNNSPILDNLSLRLSETQKLAHSLSQGHYNEEALEVVTKYLRDLIFSVVEHSQLTSAVSHNIHPFLHSENIGGNLLNKSNQLGKDKESDRVPENGEPHITVVKQCECPNQVKQNVKCVHVPSSHSKHGTCCDSTSQCSNTVGNGCFNQQELRQNTEDKYNSMDAAQICNDSHLKSDKSSVDKNIMDSCTPNYLGFNIIKQTRNFLSNEYQMASGLYNVLGLWNKHDKCQINSLSHINKNILSSYKISCDRQNISGSDISHPKIIPDTAEDGNLVEDVKAKCLFLRRQSLSKDKTIAENPKSKVIGWNTSITGVPCSLPLSKVSLALGTCLKSSECTNSSPFSNSNSKSLSGSLINALGLEHVNENICEKLPLITPKTNTHETNPIDFMVNKSRENFMSHCEEISSNCDPKELEEKHTTEHVVPSLLSVSATQNDSSSISIKPSTYRGRPFIPPDKFFFQIKSIHHMKLPDGQKLYACDICSGVYQRAFSLKRHYLRSHINYRHLTERDISNCGIVVGDKMAVQSGTNTKIYMQNSKIISVGSTLSQETLNCNHIVEEQCTTSDGIKTETVSNDTGILIIPCVSNGTVKLQGESTYNCEPIQDNKNKSTYTNIPLENSSFKEVIGTNTSDMPIHFPGLYRCHTCGICFDEKDDLKSHLSNHPPTATNVVIGENNTYACNQCNATFTHKHNYLRHCASAVHNKNPVAAIEETQERCLIKVHLCLYCDKGFKSAAIRKRHQGRMHKKQKGPGKRKYHACPYCSKLQKKFKDFSLLMEHMVSSHPDKYHGCVMCAIRFDSKESFNKHLETSHMKTKLKIPKPDIAESNKSTLVVDVSQTTNSDVTVNSLPVIQRVNLKETSQSSTHILNESSLTEEKETINENEDSTNKPADLLNSVGDEFRYTCGVCQKMFTNYVNMCRHRRLAHGTVTAKTKKAKQGPKDFETASVCSSASSQNNGSSRSQSPAVVKTLTGSPAKVKAPARPQLTQQFQTVEISEKLLDPETLFYSKVASNIRENLLHHLDGKLECSDNVNKEKEPERSIAIDRPKRGEKILLKLDLVSSVALNGAPHNRMSLLAQSISSEVSKVSGRRDGLVHKVSWEKYNFPKNYDGRGDGLASYIKDMSHLDISTQLVMRQNLQRLNSEPTSPTTKDEIDNSDFDFPRGLCLMKNDVAKTESISTPTSPKPELSRTNSSPSVPSCMDVKDKSIIELDCPKSTGARRKSLSDLKVPALSSGSMQRDFPQDSALESAVELSGEWVRPRKYICGACGERFRDLYILEDHKYSVHPNVWCTHLEFEESTIAGMSFDDKSNSQLPFPGSLCRRFLNPTGALTSANVVPPTKASESSCTKCSKVLNSLSDLHRHMLECGGDNTWMLTMVAASPSGGRRNRKWRPFGSRRRRQQGRRGMKRNIPSSPMKLPQYRARHRATDIDSIQRMISNLPAKRATRRVIQFSEDDIKTRSQATIHSNRLLRKRYKVTFAPSLPRTHHKHTIGRHRLKSSANEALKFEVKKKKSAISRVLSAASAKKHSKPLSDLPLTEPAGLVVEKSSTFSDNGLVNNISVEQTLKQVPQIEDTDTSEAYPKSKEKWQSSRNVLSKKRLSVMKGKLPKTLLLDKEDKSQEDIPTKSSATNAYTSSAVSEEKPAEKIGKGRRKKVVVSTKIMRKSLVSVKLRKKKSSVIPSKTHSLEATDPSATHDILMTIVPRRSGRTASLTRDKDSTAEDKTVSSPIVDTELHSLPVPFQSASYAQEDDSKPISNASTSVAKESSNILETLCAVPPDENNSEDKAKRDLTSDIDNSRKIKLVGPGKGKKIEIRNANKKTKLKKKIEPEEKKIKSKGYTHPDEQISETNICEGCGLQFDNNSAYGRHIKTCIYVKKLENMSQPSIDATNIVSHQCNKCLEVFNSHTSLVEHSKVCTLASKESEVVKRKPGRPPKIKCIQNDDLNLLTTEEIKNPDIKMPELQKEEPVVSVKRVGRPKKIKESSDEIPVLSPASKMETTTQTNFTNNEILSKVKNKVVKRNHPKEAPRSIIKEDTPLTELLTTVKETIFDSLDEMKTENNDVIDSQELKHTRRSKHKKYLIKTDTQSVPLISGEKHTSEEETINVDKTTPPPSLAEDDLETTKISLESTPDLQDTSCFESLSIKDDETLSKPKPNITKKAKVDSKDDIVKNKTDAVKKNLFGLVKKSSKSFIKKHSKLPSQIDSAALQNMENVPLKSIVEGNDFCLKTKVEKVSKKTSKMGLVLSTKTIKESKELHQIDTTTTKQSNEIISKFKIKKLINKKCKQHNTLKKVSEKITDTDTELDIKGETIIKNEFDVFLPPIKNIGIKNSKTLRKKLVSSAKNSKNNTTKNSLLIVDENLAKINSDIDLDKEIKLYSETENKKCSSKKKTKQFKVSQSEMIEENHNCDIKSVFDYKSKTIEQSSPNTNKTFTRKINFKKIKTLANPITACKKKKFAKIKSSRQLNLRCSTTFNSDKLNSNKGLSKENLFAGKVVNKMASRRTSENDQSFPKISLYDSVKELENNTNMSELSISNSVDHFSKTIEAVVKGAGGSMGKNLCEKSNSTSEIKQNEQTTLQSDTVTNTNNTLQVGAQIKISKIASFCDEVPKDFSKSGLHNSKHVKSVHKKSNIDLIVSDVSLHHTSNTSGKDKDVAERTALKIEENLSSSNSWIDIDEDTLPISKLKEISVARKFGLMKVEPKVLRGRGRGRCRGRGRGRGRGFKKTSEVNGGTNYQKKSLTEVDIVQELSRETPSIDIELHNLDEDSSKDTALSYDEESKLSEQVLHMGDHFSLGGNRLLRTRRDQGGFRKDTASRFGRRESRARSTRCNLSYEEMYTSSDVASEADSQDFDAQQKENNTESQEKLVHNRQRYKKIKISKTKNTFLRHERRKKKSLRRWTMLSNQKKMFLEEKFKNIENDEAKTLFQVTGELEPEDPNTDVKLKESNYLSKQKEEIIEDACHKTPKLAVKKTAPETMINQSNMDLKMVFKVINKKDKETLSSVNSKDKSNDAFIDIQTTMAETQIAKFGNEIDSTQSIVCVAQTRLDSKETSKINLELKKMEQESKILTFVTEKKVEDFYVIEEENTTIEGKAIEITAVQDVVDSIHKDQLNKSVIKDTNIIQLPVTEKLLAHRELSKDEIEGEIFNIIKTNETQNVGSSAVHDVVENIHQNYLLTLSTKNLESVSDASIKLLAIVENENSVHNELPSQLPTNCFSRLLETCDQIAVLDVVESVHQSQLKRLGDKHFKLSPNILSNDMSNKAKNESTKKEMFNTKLTNQNSKSVISPVTPMRDVNVQNDESFHTLDQVLPEYLAVSDEQTIGIIVDAAMVDTNKYQNCDLIVPETKLQKENNVLIKCNSTEKREKAINVENSVDQSTLELIKYTVTDDPKLFCEACHESFTSSFNLAKHKLTSIHIQRENHTSDICDGIKASSNSFELDRTSDTISLTGDCLRNTNNTNTQNTVSIEYKDILQTPTISINSIENTQEQTLDDIPLSLLIKSMKGKKKSVLETSKLMSKKFGRKKVSKIHHKTIGKHNNKTLKIVKKVKRNVFKQEKVKKLRERGNDVKINVGENLLKTPFESSFSEVKVKKSTCIENISNDKNDPSSKNISIQLLDVAKENRQIVKKSKLNDENEKINHISPKITFGTNFEDKSANDVVKDYISYVNTSDLKSGNLNKCVETSISEETNCSAHHTVDINLCDTADTQVDVISSEINFDEVDLLNTGNTNTSNDNKFPVLVEVILNSVNEQIDLVTQELCPEQTESGLSSHVSNTIPDDIPEVENIIGDSISDTCFDQEPSFQKNWFYYDNCDTIENEMLCGFKKPTKDTMIETAQLSTFESDPNTLLKEDLIKVNTSISHQKLCAVQQSEDLCNSESLPQANQIQDILLHSLALAEQIPLTDNIQLNLSPSKEPEIQNCLPTDFDKELSCTQNTQLVQSPESQVTEVNTCLSLAIENQSSLVLTAKIEPPSSEKCKIQDCFSNELDEHQSLLQASHLQDHSSKQHDIQEFVSLEFEKENETLSLDKDKSSNYSDKKVLLSEDIPAKASSLHIEEIHTPLQEEPITITFAPKESHSSHYSDTETLLSVNLAVPASSQQSKVFIHSQQENIIQKPASNELPLHLPPGLDPEVEALLSLGSEIQDRSNFWTNSEQVHSYNLPETQAHSTLSTAKPQICSIQDSCSILRKGNFTTETTINHDTVATQPSNQPQVVRTSAEPPSGVGSVEDEPPKIFDAPNTKVIEIASKNSTGQKSYGGIDTRAGMTEPPEPVAVFSGTDHAVAILPDQPCWPDDASWQGTNIGWVPTNEVETSAEWTYGGAEWVPPETGPGAPDIQWIQQEGTQFGIDQLQPISSLGSILDSVNQILNTGAGTSGEQVLLNEYGGFSSTLAAGSVMTDELVDLQRAMGATDEEMLMLQKLGEDGWPLENADLMDLDNQRSRAEGRVKEQEEEQEGEVTSSPLPAKTSPKKTNQVSSIMMRRQRTEDRPFGHCQNILSQYEQKEMVCPLCNKHFLGLAALQTHVASTHNVREGPDKKMKTYERSRKAMIASIATTTLGQVINHRHMCVWCKELHVDEESLQRHVESTHSSEGSDGQEFQATTSTGVKDEGLKSHMSTALGGLLNRALGHVFHTVHNTSILKELSLSNRKQPSEEGGSSRPQTPINSVKEEVVDEGGNKSKEPLRRKSQEEDKDKPYSCHMCDVKFLVLSSRNRHIARVHGLGPKPPPEEGVLSDQSEPDFEKTWVDLYPYDWNVDASADGDMIDGSFLCLDCGINFQTPQEVLKHRQLEHTHEPSPEPKETDNCSVTKETSSNADIVGTHEDKEATSTALPVKTLDDLSEPFFVNVQGNNSECSKDTVSPGSLENNTGNKEEPLLPPLQLRNLPSSQLLTMPQPLVDNHSQQLHPPRAQTPPQTTPQPLLVEKIKCPVTNDRPAAKTSSRSIESTSRKLARSKMNVEELERQLCKNDAMIKAKAEAAIRELSLSRKGRSSASSNKWGVHRYKFTVPDRQPGVEGDNKLVPAPEDRYSYPLIRKVSNSRFASLTERMKKQCGKVNPCVAESSPEKEVLDITTSNTGSAAFAVYEFDEEESEPVTELSLRGNGGTSIIKGLPHQTGNERIKDKENDEEVIVDQETVLWSHENSRILNGKGTLKRLFKDGLETDRDKEVVVAKKPRKNSECQVSPNKSPGSIGLREYNLDVLEDRGVKRKNTFEELTPRNIIVEKQKSERFENISQTFDAIPAVPHFEKESFCSSIEKLEVENLSASPEINLPFISSKLSLHSNVETTKTILNKAHKKTEIGGGVVKGRHKDKCLSSDQAFDEILKNTVNDKKVKDKPKKQIKLVNLKGIEEHRSKQFYAGEQTRSETSTKKFNTVLDQELKNKKKDQKNKLAVHSNRPSHKSNNTQNLETLKKGNKRDQEMLMSQENEESKKSRRQVKRVSYAETLDSELEEDLFDDSIVIEDTDAKLKQKVKSSKKRLSMDEKNKRKFDKEFSTEPNTKISTIAALKRSKQKLNYSDDKSEDDSSIDNFDQQKFLASNAKISQKKDKAYSNRFFDNDSVTEDDDTSESDATDKTKKPQQRNTKTDLLKCVFAKSRRNSTTIVSGSGGCVPDVDDNIPNTHNVNVSSGHYSTNVVKHKHRSWQRVTF